MLRKGARVLAFLHALQLASQQFPAAHLCVPVQLQALHAVPVLVVNLLEVPTRAPQGEEPRPLPLSVIAAQ